MNDYRDSFGALADRGEEVGATALLERLEEEPLTTLRPRRVQVRSGLLAAAAVFALVLAVGIALAVAFRPPPDVANIPEVEIVPEVQFGPEVQFLESERSPDVGYERPVAGPGGFLQIVADAVQFSSDGQTWIDVDLPRGFDDDRPINNVTGLLPVSTNDVWMIWSNEEERPGVWVSNDGADWTRIRWEEQMQLDMSVIRGSGPGFYALTNSSLLVRGAPTWWWSTDGVDWERSGQPEPPTPDHHRFVATTASGVVWWFFGDDSQEVELAYTSDGATWNHSTLDAVAEMGAGINSVQVSQVGSRWIVFVADDAGIVHSWTSDDFDVWAYQGIPEFTRNARPGFFGGSQGWVDEIVLAPTFDDANRVAYWATTDGRSWTQVAGGLPEHRLFAANRNADGTYTVIYTIESDGS